MAYQLGEGREEIFGGGYLWPNVAVVVTTSQNIIRHELFLVVIGIRNHAPPTVGREKWLQREGVHPQTDQTSLIMAVAI